MPLYFDMQDNSEVLVGDIIKASPTRIALKFSIKSTQLLRYVVQKLHWNYLPTDR